MSEPIDFTALEKEIQEINALDPGLMEMLPEPVQNYLRYSRRMFDSLKRQHAVIIQVEPILAENRTLQTRLDDLNLAIADYATQSGQGQLMLDNLKLCLGQVQIRKQQAGTVPGMMATIGRQGKG